jgi:hypothetical protein
MRIPKGNTHWVVAIGILTCLIHPELSGGLVRAVDAKATLSATEVAALIPEIEAAERALRNIKIEYGSRRRQRPPIAGCELRYILRQQHGSRAPRKAR